MKKRYLMFFLLLFIISNNVKAEGEYKDITNDVQIKYKWYKEIIKNEGEYYPLKDLKSTDRYDKDNIKYVGSSRVNSEFCSYPEEFYRLERDTYRIYRKIYDAEYVLIENIDQQTDIEIYYKRYNLAYEIISNENNKITIHLKNKYLCDQLLFYVNTNDKYKVSLYKDSELKNLIISKELENQKISIPDSSWQVEPNAYYNTYISTIKYDETSLTTLKEEKEMCGYSEKYVYKYDVEKIYYDNNYHEYIEGYIKDEQDYKLYYKNEPIVINNTIEITKEKIKEVPKIEYIYIEKEINNIESIEKCENEIQTKIETKIVEKEIEKIPKKVYILIFILAGIILILIIKNIVKKCRIN